MASFDWYPQLPAELRVKVLAEAEAGISNILEVCFDRQPTISRTAPGEPWHIVWAYKLYTRNPPSLLSVTQETRSEYLRTRLDYLRLNRGQTIHFNAAKDTIFFDSESLFNLWHYVKKHRAQLDVHQCNLKGFNQIQTLGHFLSEIPPPPPPPDLLNTRGFYELRDLKENVFTGLKNIRLLGSRGIHPGPRPFGTACCAAATCRPTESLHYSQYRAF
jgi:2EXR family